ncbi:N-acetyltransferase [uncultured Kordia sp.]|uniref:GNAT family N-acetyltransferase n=1 Tax=uncultured Kordia sp. TaxID=507699 RepID=UPI002638CC12|nr:GNAT family N-acetyltransferase [uncultured Kordia sp.]
MIEIKIANTADVHVLALLGRVTYVESHGHFIENKNDLSKYCDNAFSVAKTTQDLQDSKNIFYILYLDDLPIGYAKLVLNVFHESIASQNNCRLERIYILNEFIPLKIGQQLLNFLEEKATALDLDTMWLSVYVKNYRAIRFYERNEFKNVGELNFLVNGIEYENTVFSKKL